MNAKSHNLKELLEGIGAYKVQGTLNRSVSSLAIDSKNAKKGGLFVAIKGTKVDGHSFIPDVIKKGILVVVCEKIPKNPNATKYTYVKVSDSKKAAGIIASNFFGKPSTKLKLVGVTGTNGKTTTATLLYQLFKKLEHKTGLLSTVRNMIDEKEYPSLQTTPDPVSLNGMLKDMVEAGCTHAFMEVSSHAVEQKRIAGLEFSGGIFTNLTHDHLDYHKTIGAYAKAKKAFFDDLHSHAFALSNEDDPYGKKMLKDTKALKKYYSLQNEDTDFKTIVVKNELSGLLLDFGKLSVQTKLIGIFNAYNLLAIYSAALMLHEDPERVTPLLGELVPPEGRFEYVISKNGVAGIVDYAHTPDALEKILKTIQGLKKENAKTITVFGCGGDRDPLKRPIMGHIASEYSDVVIVTSDNPRSEDPEDIIKQIKKGIDSFEEKKYHSIANRKSAIKKAFELASKGDIIALLGKGHEKYQEIEGVKHHFDDLEELKKLF